MLRRSVLILASLLLCSAASVSAKIDRKALVGRHRVNVTTPDTFASLSLGNGSFAFTTDITGLQTFPEYYKNGVPLGTQSEWGWHSWPNTRNYSFDSTLRYYNFAGRRIPYSVQIKTPESRKATADFFRENVHRLQLGNIGFILLRADGNPAAITDLKDVTQQLDMYKGEIHSRFTLEGNVVQVITTGMGDTDGIAVHVESPLIAAGRLQVRVRFPYPVKAFSDMGVNYQDGGHTSDVRWADNRASLTHTLDSTTYYVHLGYNGKSSLKESRPHEFIVQPDRSQKSFEFSAHFSRRIATHDFAGFAAYRKDHNAFWKSYWESGGAVDFSGSTDSRSGELERRLITSQYLMRLNCAGENPPQETGLTYNSWYGKPHIEMYWWHAAHFALWGRTELLERGMDWYFRNVGGAREIAKRQGYEGVRWQKMTDNEGRESPSSVAAFLIWQQPHLIYLAELVYRNKKDQATLKKYGELVSQTAEFMVSFAQKDSLGRYYNLGKGLIPAQECHPAVSTFNPTYELAYWAWALERAQEWRTRQGQPRNAKWDGVLKKLAPLPQAGGVYLATQSTPDSYGPDSKWTIDHPAVLAALSTLPPSNGLDKAVMNKTYDTVQRVWHWDHTWGWDFPLVAMTATRLGRPADAINDLFRNVQKNRYLPNGHNYQDKRLTIYLPGNGGLLSAVALMCAGSDDSKEKNPGFPKDGSWRVEWEGLKPMP